MFDCLQVLGARIGAKACKKRHNISNVCSGHGSKILRGANGREVWNGAHELFLFRSERIHVLGEDGVGSHLSEDRLTVRLSEAGY